MTHAFNWTDVNTRRVVFVLSIFAFLFGAVIGWAAQASSQKSGGIEREFREKIEASLRAHALYVSPETVAVEFPPTKNDDFAMFSRRLAGLQVLTSGLLQPGLTYLGGRLLPLSKAPAAILMFRRNAELISVFAIRSDAVVSTEQIDVPQSDQPFSLHSKKGYAVIVVGDVPDKIRNSLVRLIRPLRDQ